MSLDCEISDEMKENFDKAFEAYCEKVKKETGFDFKNHTQEEWNAYYLSLAEKQAETDAYEREILTSVKSVIDKKDYSHLVAVYKNYDKLVKEQFDRIAEENGISNKQKWVDLELPYWCYCCCTLPDTETEGKGN